MLQDDHVQVLGQAWQREEWHTPSGIIGLVLTHHQLFHHN